MEENKTCSCARACPSISVRGKTEKGGCAGSPLGRAGGCEFRRGNHLRVELRDNGVEPRSLKLGSVVVHAVVCPRSMSPLLSKNGSECEAKSGLPVPQSIFDAARARKDTRCGPYYFSCDEQVVGYRA